MVPCLLLVETMRGTWLVGALAVLAGCPSGEVTDADARPDGDDDDGGLRIRFTTDQPVPGEVAADRRFEEVHLRAGSVRAIGDAAPGDSRTTRNEYELRWHESDTPEAIVFEEAPVGLYSSVEVRLEAEGDDDDAFELEGRAMIEESWFDFEIHGRDSLTIMIATSTELEIGGTATIEIDVDLASMIAGLDFSEFPQVEGRIEIDGDSTLIRDAVRDAFAAAPPVGGGGDG